MLYFAYGKDDSLLTVATYEVVNKSQKEILPNQEYKGKILSGAKRWELPAEYQEKLRAIKVKQ